MNVIERLNLLAQAGEGSPFGNLMPIVTMFLPLLLLWIFLLERPRRKQLLQREQAIKAIKKNDRVVTSGGIYGVVTSVQLDANEVTVRVDETNNTRLRVTLSSIERILGSDTPDKQESAK